MPAFASLPPAGPLHLPLSGSTAERIVAALLCSNETARREQLQLTLNRDAALAIWAALAATRRATPVPRTLLALGQWLTDCALDELAWPSVAKSEVTLAGRKKQAALAAESFGIASLAGAIARLRGVDTDQAEFLGLLSYAQDWLAACLTDGPQPNEDTSLLPPWLAAELTEIARAGSSDSNTLAGCVAMAQQIAKSRSRAAPPVPGLKFDRRRHMAELDAIRRQWAESSPAVAWLPELTARLRQLRALQSDFDRALETEKLESLKELAQGAGHEINNPLANISARAQTLLNDERDPERRRLLASINTQAFRAHEMIADMMLFARPPQLHRKATDLGALVSTLADQFRAQAAAQRVELVCSRCDVPIMADVDATQIHEALAAVIINALEALVTGGRIELSLAMASDSPDQVRITIADDGPGIPTDVRRHLFDPFYSGREAGRGIGLGLSKCWRIVRQHGGEIMVASPSAGGASFTITLPTVSQPPMA